MSTDLTTLLDLLKRVRRATGPDARLDAQITCAFVLRGLRPAEPDDFDGKFGYSPGNIKTENGFLMSHHYTSSLDECVALIKKLLPSWTWYVGEGISGSEVICSLAAIYQIKQPRALAKGNAPTPALALLAALLSALIALEEKKEGVG